jgi:hypothetical protein
VLRNLAPNADVTSIAIEVIRGNDTAEASWW